MLKTNKNSNKETFQKFKTFQDTSNMNLSDDCSDEGSPTIFKPCFRCPKCCLVPFVTLKESESKVIMNCTNGHNKDIPLNEFMDKILLKKMNNIECSECGLQLQPKKRFKFCSECNKIFCKMCLKKHNGNENTKNHETISLRKMDTFCCLHKTRFAYYCEICHKNICEKCFYLHNNHQIISLKEIKLSKREIKEFRDNLDREKMNITETEDIFKNCINSIKKKFDDVIQYKKQVIEFKKIIEDIYETKDSNFQIIDNINRLKFNTQPINIEKDMNELDILFELFSYLNCIDYNICLTNSLLNLNDNSFQNNNMIQEEQISDHNNNKKKDCIYINNNYDNNYNISFNKNENINTNEKTNEKEKLKEFIYEKKNKKFFQNCMNEKEEEKNDENINNIFLTNNNYNRNLEIKDKNNYNNNDIEQKKELFKSIIKNDSDNSNNSNNNDENVGNVDIEINKSKKYSKKIMKGKLNHKSMTQTNLNKIITKEENKEIYLNKNYNEETPLTSRNKENTENQSNSCTKTNKNNIIKEEFIQFEKKSNKNNINNIYHKLVDDKEKVNDMSKSDNSDCTTEENVNINSELNNNNKELNKKKIKKKSKSKDKFTENSKEKSKKKVTKVKSIEKNEKSTEKNEKPTEKKEKSIEKKEKSIEKNEKSVEKKEKSKEKNEKLIEKNEKPTEKK